MAMQEKFMGIKMIPAYGTETMKQAIQGMSRTSQLMLNSKNPK